MTRTFTRLVSTLVVVLPLGFGACDSGSTMGMTDMPMTMTNPDMSMGTAKTDMTAPPDMVPATVTGLPTDCVAGATAAMVYTNVVSTKCAVDMCHGTNSNHWTANSAATMKTALVNKPADQLRSMNRITPSDINHSYLMYKLTGQQLKVQGDPLIAGAQMPDKNPPLDHDSLCYFISWINAGAN